MWWSKLQKTSLNIWGFVVVVLFWLGFFDFIFYYYFYSAHLCTKIKLISAEILTKISKLVHLKKKIQNKKQTKLRELSLESESHLLWNHFTMHQWVLTVLTYKAFSLQCNTCILFKDYIFYLWIFFGEKWTFNLSFKCVAWLLS